MHNGNFNLTPVKVVHSIRFVNHVCHPKEYASTVNAGFTTVPHTDYYYGTDARFQNPRDPYLMAENHGGVNPVSAGQDAANRKILVNPHFRKNVHINPKFTQQNASKEKSTIHLNPNVAQTIWKENNYASNIVKRANVHLNPHVVRNPITDSIGNIHINRNVLKSNTSRDSSIILACNDQVSKVYSASHSQNETGYSKNESKSVLVKNIEFTCSTVDSSKISNLSNQASKRNSLPAKDEAIKLECLDESSKTNLPVASHKSVGHHNTKRRNSFQTRYKIIKSGCMKRTEDKLLSSNSHIDGVYKKRTLILSKYKLIKSTSPKKPFLKNMSSSTDVNNYSRKRNNSLQTRYKIIKSKRLQNLRSTKLPGNVRMQNLYPEYKIDKMLDNTRNHYKLDNRNKSSGKSTVVNEKRKRKYVYVDKFFSIGNLAQNMLIKQRHGTIRPGYINVNGILYKKSPNSLKRANSSIDVLSKAKKSKSVFKFTKGASDTPCRVVASDEERKGKSFNSIRTMKLKKVSSSKLRKSNVPCSAYRKFGRCRGKDNGRCIKIHNPNQIVLCTKFLQGACINKNCLLSHKISPEKMPTCKYYLEGSCSREDCQYLHVKISPKAEICKAFLEGFCERAAEVSRSVKICLKMTSPLQSKPPPSRKVWSPRESFTSGSKNILHSPLVQQQSIIVPLLHLNASQRLQEKFPKITDVKSKKGIFYSKPTSLDSKCDKRHQFLCPDYENNGTCPRKRCEYPHGERVRKINSSKKYAKKYSTKIVNKSEVVPGKNSVADSIYLDSTKQNLPQKCLGARYFEEQNQKPSNSIEEDSNLAKFENKDNQRCDTEAGVKSRPKLGNLPSYIPLLGETS